MRACSAVVVVCAMVALCVCRNPLPAFDERPAVQQPASQIEKPQTEKQANTVRSSDKAVVRDVVYGLEEEENRLYLTSQPLDGNDRQLKRVQIEFAVPKDSQIVELSLAKLDGKNLMAVLKVQRGEEFDFHCLTFIGPWNGGHVRDRFGFHKAKFFTTHDDLKILAVGGKHFAGSVFIVLGEMGLDNDGEKWVTQGSFYFSGCPWPPSDGILTNFRVTEVLQKDRTD